MANIQVLDQNTINQIAAGEVIERPSSVVKELLENAIDSRATAITVEIQGGGINVIRVTDNGCGIPRDEIPLAFKRHATSKIRTADDLFQVASLGFRGEALASIASVAKVELITKTTDSISGCRYCIEGGEEKNIEEVGAPEGTTFIARDLFFNTPVRKKFIKTPAAEGSHVADLVEKIAMSHPEISFRFISNSQMRLHTSGNHSLRDIVYTVYGREVASNLIAVESGSSPVRIEGFIGKPLVARGNRNFENYFINGRFIRSGLINKAIEEAYKPYMMQHKYPFTMLQFTIDPAFIDVNVHPAKMELRFRDGDMIYRMVYHTVSMALSDRELIPGVLLTDDTEDSGNKPLQEASPQTGQTEGRFLKPARIREKGPEPFEKNRLVNLYSQKTAPHTDSGKPEPENSVRESLPAAPRLKEVLPPELKSDKPVKASADSAKEVKKDPDIPPSSAKPEVPDRTSDLSVSSGSSGSGKKETVRQMDLFEDKLLSRPARAEHVLLGQLFDTYWLVQYRDSLYIIDQHAAHEKVLYEKTMASLRNRDYTSQIIYPPIILTLNSSEQLKLERYMKYFTSVGFEIEPFGGKEYAVRAVPANLFSIAQKDLLIEMLDNLDDNPDGNSPDIVNERIASMSCKAAVKGNHAMSPAEANRLIDELLELENPYACPHGRPTIISMSKYELEKKFKRIV